MQVMNITERKNQTEVVEFIHLGFRDLQGLNILLFLLFLLIYIFTMTGNLLILGLVVSDHRLHTPMYFFLGNLSYLETCYTTTILPKILSSILTGNRSISISGCIAQFYFFASLVVTECGLLAMMSYDRYLAICKPLHYSTIMNSRVCLSLAGGSWINGFVAMAVLFYLMSRLTFCGASEIDHFFCDFTPVIELACSENHILELMGTIFSSMFTLIPFLLTVTSYIFIISTILRIPSASQRQKAFSTCSSHLIVVTIFYGSLIIVYVMPWNETMKELNKVFSLFYTVLTPLVNPLIYSLRNREVKEALRKCITKHNWFSKISW